MNIKKSMALIAMGVGGTLLYQQIKNGNVRKCIKDMERFAKESCNEMYDNLEDMM